MDLLRKMYKKIHRYWVQRSSEAYLNYLRKSGFKIGDTPFPIMAALCLPLSYISFLPLRISCFFCTQIAT